MKTLYKYLSIVILAIMATDNNALSQEASDYTKNPYGLVYRGAITENRQGEVNIHPVHYNLNYYCPLNFRRQ